MLPLNIFLSPFAYYVRLDVPDLEEQKKLSGYKKWVDNRKGQLSYEFIEFERLDEDFDTKIPMKTTAVGVIGSRFLCYNPFAHKTMTGAFILVPNSIEFDHNKGLTLCFIDRYTATINQF